MIEIIVTGISYAIYGFVCVWIGYDMGIKREKERSEIDEVTRALAKQVEANSIWKSQQREQNVMDRQDIICGRKPIRKREIKIVN